MLPPLLRVLASGSFLFTAFAQAQVSLDIRARTPAAEPSINMRVDSNLVLVPVVVSDSKNRPVVGLDKQQFRIFDNKVEQTVTQFAMDDEPLAIGLVFDVSGSMGKKLRRARAAATEFFRTTGTEDEFFLVTFSDQPKLVVPLTSNAEQIQNSLTFSVSKGNTALLDAIYLAMTEIRSSNKPRKALLVISDGGDNNSRYTEGELKSLVRESDVLIYGIGIFEAFGARGRSLEELSGPDLLSEIAEQTGGREFPVDNLKELPDVAAKIGIELHNRYVLGFSPTGTQHDGRYHQVQVKVVRPHGMPKLEAHWRAGYYAGAH